MKQFCEDMVIPGSPSAVKALQPALPHHGVPRPGLPAPLQEHAHLLPAQLATLPPAHCLHGEVGQGAAREQELGVLAGDGGEAGGLQGGVQGGGEGEQGHVMASPCGVEEDGGYGAGVGAQGQGEAGGGGLEEAGGGGQQGGGRDEVGRARGAPVITDPPWTSFTTLCFFFLLLLCDT